MSEEVRMTKKEAVIALCGMAQVADEAQLRAIALGCKALARDAIHKARNKAAQKKRGAEAGIELRPNRRGFLGGTFRDNKGEKCSLQESSNVKPCVWLGIDEPQPVVMSDKVAGLASPRLEPIGGATETTGWHRYILPDGVRVFGRMELDRETAGRLADALAHFAKNGTLLVKGGAQ